MPVRRPFALVLLGLLLAAGSVAQEVAEPAAPVATPVAEPSPIPVPRIPEESERLQQTLRRIANDAMSDPDVAAIEAGLPAQRDETQRRLDQTVGLLATELSINQFRDLEAEWSSRLGKVASRRLKLAVRASTLETDMESLASQRALWTTTLEHARATDSPANVLEVVGSNLDRIDGVTEQLQARRAALLTLLTAISDLELRATDALQRIEQARAAMRARLLEPDADPLWSAIGASRSDLPLGAVWRSIVDDWKDLVSFVELRRRSGIPLLIAFCLALTMAFIVRDRMRLRASSDHLEGSAGIFERPISVALIVAALLVSFVFPFVPSLAWDIIAIVLLVPILRLLVPIVPDMLRPAIGLLALFFLVDQARDLLRAAPLVERIAFFAEMIAAAFVIGTFLLSVRRGRSPAWSDAVGRAAPVLRLVLMVFLAAAFANALGYVSFARVIADGTVTSIYLGVVAYAVYRIGLTLVVLALYGRWTGGFRTLQRNLELVTRWAKRVLAAAVVLFFGKRALDAYSIGDVVVAAIQGIVSTPIEVGTISVSLGSILAFPMTLLAAYLVSGSIRAVLEEDVFPRVTLKRGVGNAITSSVHYAILLGGFLLALGAAGIDLTRFTLLAGAFGVGVGFGLQNVVNNFVSGLILLFERPIQVGDMIEMGDLLGEVKKIGIRASTIVTFRGAEVIVPNGNLLSDQLINWTLSNRNCRIEIPVGVAYGNNPEAVKAVLQRVLDSDERVLDDPTPVVLFRGFGDSSLDFELRFWISDYMTFPKVTSDVACRAYDALEAAEIVIPFPQRDLHLKSIEASVADSLRRGRGAEE